MTTAQVALVHILLPTPRNTFRNSRIDVLLGLSLLTALAITMRLELVGLLAPLAVQSWACKYVDWLEGGFALLASVIASASKDFTNPTGTCHTLSMKPGLSLSVDSYFWRYTVLPELSGFIFNVLEGRSAEWGVGSDETLGNTCSHTQSAYRFHHGISIFCAIFRRFSCSRILWF